MPRRTLWRIAHRDRAKDAKDAFGGRGAAKYGGRWNTKGTPLVYTAESLAGAMVELLAYFKDVRSLETRVYFRVEVDEVGILDLDPEALPSDWKAYPYPPSTQRIGSRWAEDHESVGLRVPSVLIPESYNVLLNPRHPRYEETVEIDGPYPLEVDGRIAELLERAGNSSETLDG